MKKHLSIVVIVFLASFSMVTNAVSESPYGICAHVTRDGDFQLQDKELRLMQNAGIANARSDYDWSGIQSNPNEWNFKRLDTVMTKAEKAGVQMLPILGYTTSFADPARKHLDLWESYVRHIAEHYGKRLPVLEVWNEQNLWDCWGDDKVGSYLELLKTTSKTVKAIDPKLRVAIGGYSGVPLNEIEELYKRGGGKYFDIMNIHPYKQPSPPESYLEATLQDLRTLMAKHGDAEKPIWITEIGWPTQKPRIAAPGLLKTGLKVAKPEKKDAWRIAILADPDFSTTSAPSTAMLTDELPLDAVVQHLTVNALYAALDASAVDAVVLPLDERFPYDNFDKVLRFVKRGGVIIDFGGMPLWYPMTRGKDGRWIEKKYAQGDDFGRFRRDLRIVEEACWYKRDVIPETMTVDFVGPAKGLAQPKNGFEATRYLQGSACREGDQFTPLLAGKKKGYVGVAAAVYKFNSDMKGAAIVCTLPESGQAASTETAQAKILPRAYLIALQFGVEKMFWYSLRAFEGVSDAERVNPECHFGIVHNNLTPKPAYHAYKTLAIQRPSGSVKLSRDWKSKDGMLYYPQWKRPDGRIAGAVWAYRKPGVYRLTFSTKPATLTSYDGQPIAAEWDGSTCSLPLNDAVIYFSGATLEQMNAVAESH